MPKAVDRQWIEEIRTNLHRPNIDRRSEMVAEFLGCRPAARDRMCDSGLGFGLKLRDRYRVGQCLGVPGDNGWMIGPEYMFDRSRSLGHFDDSLVLSIVAARDPSSVMALSALARVTERAVGSDLLAGILGGVAAEARQAEVREALGYAADRSFRPDVVADIQKAVEEKVGKIRHESFRAMKEGLTQLFDGALEPAEFVERFFELSERTRIRMDIYASMVQTLIRSRKVRPMVKLLLVEQIERMPKAVRFQLVTEINGLADPGQRYLREELACTLEKIAGRLEQSAGPTTARVRNLLN